MSHYPGERTADGTDTARSMRDNAWSAGIAAVLMCLYGFFWLAKPTPTDLFSWSGLVFYHTLRIGGVVMAVVAVWSLSGRRTVLVVDAVASIVIGTLFMLSAMGMVVNDGSVWNGALIFIFGWLFIRSGVHDWRMIGHVPTRREYSDTMEAAPESEPRRMAESFTPNRSMPRTLEEIESVITPAHHSTTVEPVQAAPDGFLATFGKKPPPPPP